MNLSVFDLFKIGIGPSSSHTVGPMRAAAEFAELACAKGQITAIHVELFGSLSATGKGHATDLAVIAGLSGKQPDQTEAQEMQQCIDLVRKDQTLYLNGQQPVTFTEAENLIFSERSLPAHPNAMTLTAVSDTGEELKETYYSVGGGFVLRDGSSVSDEQKTELTIPFSTGAELLQQCAEHGLRIHELMLVNECAVRSKPDVDQQLLTIWHVMNASVDAGLQAEGILPGGLNVQRRAKKLHQAILQSKQKNIISSTFNAMEWVNIFAMAVNEENAACGRVVTAPTNGAAGIIPAVLRFYLQFEKDSSEKDVIPFLLAAGAIGALCKHNASISGAEVGCQGEVGSASAMAAAGLAEVLGGTPEQVENAAEIALEHNLGLTCDPIGGLVQVPCIERNAVAAVKAINAAQIALMGNGDHLVSLDKALVTMRETGLDMSTKYKETSTGGLAVNLTEC